MQEAKLVEIFFNSLPAPWMILMLGPLFTAFTLAAAFISAYLKTCKDVQTPYTRKIFHFIIFSGACGVHLIWGLPAVTLFGSIVSICVLYAVYRGDGFSFYEALARPSDEPRRSVFVIVPLFATVLGGIVSNLLSPALLLWAILSVAGEMQWVNQWVPAGASTLTRFFLWLEFLPPGAWKGLLLSF